MKRVGLVSAAVVLAISSLGVIAPRAYAAAQTCVWAGNSSSDKKFSTASNWTSCNSDAPQTGDVIKLPHIAATTALTLTNDLSAGTLLGGLTLDTYDSTTQQSTDYTIDKLAFGDGAVITNVTGWGVHISDTVTSTGALTLDGTGDPFYPTTKNINLTPTNLTYTNVPAACMGAQGDYTLSIKPTGQVSVGAGSWYGIEGTEASVVVASTGAITVPSGTYGGNITFNGGGTAQGKDCAGVTTYSLGTSWAGNSTLSGTITLAGGDILYNVGSGQTLTITGTINGSSSKFTAYPNSAGTFVNNAATNNSATQGGSQTVAMHEVAAVTDSQPTVSLDVNSNEILSFDGVRSSAYVAAKAVLKGSGTVTGQLYVSAGGSVAPGHSPGCLTSDVLSLYGEYQFELGGTDPCTGYDQLVVKNAASSTPAVTIDNTSATLTTSRYNSYTPKQGQVFVIINQAGSAAVSGTFKDLPEGATFTQNGVVFKISYVGGDGNDVTLTVQNQPTAPNTGVEILRSNPLLIAGATLAGVVVLLGLARFSAKRR